MSFNYTVEKPSSATYGFSLNTNNYYESTNKGVNSSYAMAKLNFTTDGSYKLYLDCINYAEKNYDFGILSELDKTLQMSDNVDSTNVKKNFKGSSSPNVQTVDYGQIANGSHYIYIKFRKDSSTSSNNDSLQFKVRTEQAMPVLESPTISLNGDILTITPVTHATSYKVFSNNTLLTTSTTTTVNLSTLFSESGTYTITATALANGYLESGPSNAVIYKLQLVTLDLTTLNLSQGTHAIKVKAKAEGYGDSAFSNQVSYTVLPQLEAPTISLNGNLLSSSTVQHATSYAIYSNNTLLTTITTTSVDLSTLITTQGTYTIYVIAKATGYVDSVKSNEVSYIKIDNWKCTVANLGSENPTSVTFTHEGTMPTFEEITFNSDIFIKIPTMYRKVNTVVDNQITSYTISNNKTDDEYKPYPCFLKEDGITIMPYILIGKYFSSSSTTCNSIQTYATSNYSENGRANAVAKGAGYQLYDWMMHKLWQDLITCKMNNININSGTGIDTDSLGLYWSSYEAYIDGISHFPAFVAFSYKPTAYIDNPRWNSPNYNSDIYAISQNSGVIKNLGYNSDHPFVNYPTSAEKSSENIYYCDVYTSSTDTSPIISTIGGKSKNYGAFFVNAASGWRVKHYIRLCYRPINE